MLALAEVFGLTRLDRPYSFNAEQLMWALKDCFELSFGATNPTSVVAFGPTSRKALTVFSETATRQGMREQLGPMPNDSDGNGGLLRNMFAFAGVSGEDAERVGYMQSKLTHSGEKQALLAALHARIGWELVNGASDLDTVLGGFK